MDRGGWCKLASQAVHCERAKTSRRLLPSTVAWWKNPGVIYFVAAGKGPSAIKIGMAAITGHLDLTATIVRRLSQIQSSNHERICLLGVIHFTHDNSGEHPTREAEVKERELHEEFEHLCRFAPYTRGAEWFDPSDKLLERIEQIATKPEALQLPRYFSSVAKKNGVECP
jgi:hypothetical protein